MLCAYGANSKQATFMRGDFANSLKLMPYEALDFYDVDSLLTDEERMVRDMVRDFVDEEVIPKSNMLAEMESSRRMESCPR